MIHALNSKKTQVLILKAFLSRSNQARPNHKPNTSCGMCLLLMVRPARGSDTGRLGRGPTDCSECVVIVTKIVPALSSLFSVGLLVF